MFSNKRVFVGISGGVDSSVAALLLIEQGFDVHGVFMQNWDSTGYCSSYEDLEDAQEVCNMLRIPLHLVNFTSDYLEKVFKVFIDDYKSGKTPNPDTLCNSEIKFRVFLDYARSNGADYIATGHYARNILEKNQYKLFKGLDKNKDQSYFLYGLNQTQLKYALFPIGHLQKYEVRAIAASAQLITHNKKDSTGICFIGKRSFNNFISCYIPNNPGLIISVEGEVLGMHNGLFFHTIGQRRGLKIGGLRHKSNAPWYVVGKNIDNNILIIAQGYEHPSLFKKNLLASKLQWINQPNLPMQCTAKIRYRQVEQSCLIEEYNNSMLRVSFFEKQRALTPGQVIVVYSGEQCLGGGIIDSVYD